MKKIVLALLLLTIVVAVSLIKTYRGNVQQAAIRNQARSQMAGQVADLQRSVDSVVGIAGERESQLVDSLARLDQKHSWERDLLQMALDAQRVERDKLTAELAQRPAGKPTNTATAVSKREADRHRQILEYYKKRYAELPSDLSDYEKDVARREIREESALKFTISINELDRIRKIYNLNY